MDKNVWDIINSSVEKELNKSNPFIINSNSFFNQFGLSNDSYDDLLQAANKYKAAFSIDSYLRQINYPESGFDITFIR